MWTTVSFPFRVVEVIWEHTGVLNALRSTGLPLFAGLFAGQARRISYRTVSGVDGNPDVTTVKMWSSGQYITIVTREWDSHYGHHAEIDSLTIRFRPLGSGEFRTIVLSGRDCSALTAHKRLKDRMDGGDTFAPQTLTEANEKYTTLIARLTA